MVFVYAVHDFRLLLFVCIFFFSDIAFCALEALVLPIAFLSLDVVR